MSFNIKKLQNPTEKAQAVRDAIQSVAPNRVRNWTRNLFTDEDAFEIIDGCLEGDFDPRTEWDQALNQFKRQFPCYANHCQEELEDYEREFGNGLEP